MNVRIRPEGPDDAQAIDCVTVAAFATTPHTDHTEHFIVRALRAADALTVSLVAEADGKVVGHVAVSPVAITDGSLDWFGLGPISVLPAAQGRGIGSALMVEALQRLRNRPAAGCVLLGDPAFYRRFGFRPVAGLALPGVPAEYFLALAFGNAFPQGNVTYHPAFKATA